VKFFQIEGARVLDELFCDTISMLAWDLSSFDTDHNFSPWESVEDIYDSEAPDCLSGEVKWSVHEHTCITELWVNSDLVFLSEFLELIFQCIFWGLRLVQYLISFSFGNWSLGSEVRAVSE
jgi:hypothetical protein